jgi:hypothetical protein
MNFRPQNARQGRYYLPFLENKLDFAGEILFACPLSVCAGKGGRLCVQPYGHVPFLPVGSGALVSKKFQDQAEGA